MSDKFDDTDAAELAAMAAGASPGVRNFSDESEAITTYLARATSAAEFATHEFYTKTVYPETEGQVRYVSSITRRHCQASPETLSRITRTPNVQNHPK